MNSEHIHTAIRGGEVPEDLPPEHQSLYQEIEEFCRDASPYAKKTLRLIADICLFGDLKAIGIILKVLSMIISTGEKK